jgi:hypothetical protein
MIAHHHREVEKRDHRHGVKKDAVRVAHEEKEISILQRVARDLATTAVLASAEGRVDLEAVDQGLVGRADAAIVRLLLRAAASSRRPCLRSAGRTRSGR